jgi:magnesium chelatase family protein
LDGTLRPVKGAMPMAIEARDRGFEGLFLPADNYKEAAVIRGLKVFGAESLKQADDYRMVGHDQHRDSVA